MKKNQGKFYDKIVAGIKEHVNPEIIKCVVVAGPGFLKNEFMKYLQGLPSGACG